MGITTIMISIEALEAYKEDSAIKDSNVDEKALVAMRMLYSAGADGMAEAHALYQSLLSGDTTTEIGGTDLKTLHLAGWGKDSRASAGDDERSRWPHPGCHDGRTALWERDAQRRCCRRD